MGKFFITNSKTLYGVLREQIADSEYDLCFDNRGQRNIYALTTRKLFVKNDNAFSHEGDFSIINGTVVYNDAIGREAARKLLEEDTNDIWKLRSKATGNYSIGIFKNGILKVFGEASAVYDVFYYHDTEEWLISSSLFDMAQVLKDRITVNKLNIIEDIARYGIFNNETIFHEIYRLSGEKMIQASETQIAVIDLGCDYWKTRYSDGAENIKEIADLLKNKAKTLSLHFGVPTLGVTGGLDSRMNLAAYLAAGVKPMLTYGIGNCSIALSNRHDDEINRVFCKKFKLKYQTQPWNETIPADMYWGKYIGKYGQGSMVYCSNHDTMHFFENTEAPFMIFGYYGEMFRNLYDFKKETITIEELLDVWGYDTHEKNIIEKYVDLQELIKKHLLLICHKYSLDAKAIKIDDVFYFYLEYYRVSSSHTVNIVNRMKYCNMILSESEIVKRANISLESKSKAKFMLKILNELYPDVLDVPVFSHMHKMNFDRNQGILKSRFVDILASKLPVRLKYIIRKYILRQAKALNPTCIELLKKPKYRKYIQDALPENIASYVLSLNGCNNIFVTKLIMQMKILKSFH